jgi:nitroreductase
MSTDEAIRRRRSTRNYDPEVTIPFAALSTLLTSSNQPVSSDFMGSHGTRLVDQYLIVNGVESLRQGIYAVEPARSELEPLVLGDFRDAAAGIACAQGYAATGQVNIYYLVNLEPLLDAWGDRGYRVAQFEGALRAEKLHLATHTMGLGAVGSTSVDDEVIRLFSPHAAGKSYMFVLVFGKRRRAAG